MIALYWLALALIAFGIEAVSRQFVLLFVAVGAGIAAFAAEFGVPMTGQIVIFAVASITLPILLRRPLLNRFHGQGVPSRTDVLLGAVGVVTETIDPIHATGRVKVAGQDWMARSAERIDARQQVEVIGADGIVLLVEPTLADPLSPS